MEVLIIYYKRNCGILHKHTIECEPENIKGERICNLINGFKMSITGNDNIDEFNKNYSLVYWLK